MIDINLMGPINVLECFVGPMVEAGRGGHIVNVSSAAGLFGLPWHAAYSASKFGVRGDLRGAALRPAPHGIGVSLVCPGAVKTPLVGTVGIVGVDRTSPRIAKLVDSLRAPRRQPRARRGQDPRPGSENQYMVFTSRDIRVGYFFQRKLAFPYELAMLPPQRPPGVGGRKGLTLSVCRARGPACRPRRAAASPSSAGVPKTCACQ